MSDMKSIRVINFSGRTSDWEGWSEKFLARSKRKGYKKLLTGKDTIPTADEEQCEPTDDESIKEVGFQPERILIYKRLGETPTTCVSRVRSTASLKFTWFGKKIQGTKQEGCQTGWAIWEYFVLDDDIIHMYDWWYVQYVRYGRHNQREVLRRSIGVRLVHDWQLCTNEGTRLRKRNAKNIFMHARTNRGLCLDLRPRNKFSLFPL